MHAHEPDTPILTLYQAEWCPHSHAVRMRLTELGVDFVCRQVEAEREQREQMRARVGDVTIPTLVDEDGKAVTGEGPIIEYLHERYGRAADADGHRAKLRDEREEWLSAMRRETGEAPAGS